MTPPTGLRARKKLATRDALVAAALALFDARGFDAVTADEIARAAGVSRRTFFRYFPSKEAVFFAPQEARLAAFEARLAQVQPGEPAAAVVREAVLEMAAVYMAERPRVLAAHAVLTASRGLAAWDQQLDGRWEAALAGALEGELGAPRAAVMAGALIGMVRAGLRRWFAADAGFDLVAFGEQAFRWLAEGLPLAPAASAAPGSAAPTPPAPASPTTP